MIFERYVETDRPLWRKFEAFMDQEFARIVEAIEEQEDLWDIDLSEIEPLGSA